MIGTDLNVRVRRRGSRPAGPVSLNPPVGGLSQTTVNVPHQVSYTSGQTVAVLVDPRAPGYAELPGVPDVTAKD